MKAGPFFLLRTPLLPVETFLDMVPLLRCSGASAAELPDAAEADRAALRTRLRALIQEPAVREALVLASPDLFATLPEWLERPDGERGQKIERALIKYVARMSLRPTPFGLFAGCTLGALGGSTALTLGDPATHRRASRLDNEAVERALQVALADPGVRSKLGFVPNTSLYEAGGRLRFVEVRGAGALRSFALAGAEPSPALLAALARADCDTGARPDELAAAVLVAEPEVAPEDAASFVDVLIREQLVVPLHELAVTGDLPALQAADSLREAAPALAAALRSCNEGLSQLDAAGLGAAPAAYSRLAAPLQGLVDLDARHTFQVDLFPTAVQATLGPDVVAAATRALTLVRRVGQLPPNAELLEFRARFAERYGDREVPLAEALDPEVGIGFGGGGAEPSALLEGIPGPGGGEPAETFAARDRVLLARFTEAWQTGSSRVTLTDADIDAMAAPGDLPRWPASMAVGATWLLEDGHHKLFFQCVAGASAGRLLGRFCHGEPRLEQALVEHFQAEEASEPDAVFAEIVHLPDGRLGNVVARPHLRRYDLPYLGGSGHPRSQQITWRDLHVRIRSGVIELRSLRLGRRVVPRLSTAHVYTPPDTLTAYRFLGYLQAEGCARLGFGVGALSAAPFVPRIEHRDLILALAHWRVGQADLAALAGKRGAPLISALRDLRARLRLPRVVRLMEGDNLLPVDFDNVLAAEAFAAAVAGKPFIELEESLDAAPLQVVQGPRGAHTHELLIPFLGAPLAGEATAPPGALIASAPATAGQGLPAEAARSRGPGSDWLYLKLYCGPVVADRLLASEVASWIAGLRADGLLLRWFFVRYADPAFHVRLRLQGDPALLVREVLPRLLAAAEPWRRRDLVYRIAVDTYEQEVERYGGPAALGVAEELFCADSDAALGLLTCPGPRWSATLSGLVRLSAALGYEDAEAARLFATLAEAWRPRGVDERAYKTALSTKARNLRPQVVESLAPPEPGSPVEALLAGFRERLREPVAGLRALAASRRLAGTWDDLAGSFLHMHCNRTLRGDNNAQEAVLYELLGRELRSLRARRAGS